MIFRMDAPKMRRVGIVAMGVAALAGTTALVAKKTYGPDVSPVSHTDTRPEREKKYLLSAEKITALREEAIKSLIASVPEGKKFDHLRHDEERLRAESEMYTPSESEQADVRRKSAAQLPLLALGTETNGYGFFEFADVDESGEEQHRLYVMKKDSQGTMHFVVGFRNSMAEKGFTFKKIEGFTQLGLHYFTHAYEGRYGEVVDVLPDKLGKFKRVHTDANGKDHHFVSDFGGESGEPPAVITDRYTIDAGRGLHFHGSNLTGKWADRIRKIWKSMLRGAKSGACGRMAHADVRVLGTKYIQLRITKPKTINENGKEKTIREIVQHGTPIYIHATPPVIQRSEKRIRAGGESDSAPRESAPKSTRSGNPGSSGTRPDPFALNN
mgnify:FL=1